MQIEDSTTDYALALANAILACKEPSGGIVIRQWEVERILELAERVKAAPQIDRAKESLYHLMRLAAEFIGLDITYQTEGSEVTIIKAALAHAKTLREKLDRCREMYLRNIT
jgi:hypothetical protein